MKLVITFKNGNITNITPERYAPLGRVINPFFISQDEHETSIIDKDFTVLEEFKTNAIQKIEWTIN
jgi:hypothetical protein